jgi:Holliday junction resolvase
MSNKRFGLDKERLIVNDLKEEGFDIVARTAGSHSAIDVFAIHRKKKTN